MELQNIWHSKVFIAVVVASAAAVCLFLVLLISTPPEVTCPSSCDDQNPCTSDYCRTSTGSCAHDALSGAQGSCSGEEGCTYRTCESGMCVERIKDVCCGDGKCTAPEDSQTCPEDCKAPFETNCTDGKDNDGDFLTDCMDSDCKCEERDCGDGKDNDEDGLTDCCDPDCGCAEVCGDGKDNDCDGLVDCCDSDCTCSESCFDGEDNDCDGLVDCCDSDCTCAEVCDDGKDNDCDGAADERDDDCAPVPRDPVDCDDVIVWNEFLFEFGRDIMEDEEDFCEDVLGGDWRKKTNEVGCYTGNEEAFDCDDMEEDAQYAEFEEFCDGILKGASWKCQVNYWGCLCRKDAPDEPEEEYCEELGGPEDDYTCRDLPCENDSLECRPVYDGGELSCGCVEESSQEGSNCGDRIDNDNDGLIDCMDPDCCSGRDQCCCYEVYDWLEWESCWPDCYECFCYSGTCTNDGSACGCLL